MPNSAFAFADVPINRPAGLDLVMGLRRGNAEGNASSAECSPFRQIGTTGRVARSPTVGDSRGPSYLLMPARLTGDDDGRRRLPPESAVVVCDRARQRSGGVSDPPPKRGKCLPPGPGGSLTPPLRTCLFTWYAAVHASRCASAMPRALTPSVFAPTPTVARSRDQGCESCRISNRSRRGRVRQQRLSRLGPRACASD